MSERPTEFRDHAHAAVEWAAQYLDTIRERPVLAQTAPGDIRRALPPSPPEHGESFAAVMRDLEAVLMPGVTHWQHPRFFAYFANTASEPGIIAEFLAATLNSVAFIWRTGPASTELELHMLDWLAQLLGLPGGWHGHIEDTASTSTLAALCAAREATGRHVVVCSEHAHSSVEKAARILGMETRKVPSDPATFAMRAELAQLDDAAAVVATVGTTSSTAIDPVEALADRAEAAGAWLHVDAAYAGSSWVCEETRHTMAGVARADSLVINPHKWLLTPMDCSCLWTRRPEAFKAAFSLTPDYLKTPEITDSLSEYGPALGRRFRALKLWAVLRCYGRDGLQAMIREHLRLAALFESWVRETPGWEICAPRPFSLVCFRRDGDDAVNEAICERVNAGGEAFIGHTRLGGRTVIRFAVGNARTTEADVRAAWEAIQRAASGTATI